MLNNIRNFSKTLSAKVLLVIIIIPFVFWGMGGVFNRGNTNNIVKINNHSISAQDFMDYLNNSRIDANVIKENINNNILEELLSGLISNNLLEMEMKKLNLLVDEKSLAKRIMENEKFKDENGNFSRTKYEKFLISQNLSAVDFETNLKNNELKKQLFLYLSGGIKSPYFITNNLYKSLNGKLEIEFINLENAYKKKIYSETDFKEFISENQDKLVNDHLDFSYIKIYPRDLTGAEEFSELFFEKIDEIENKVLNNVSFENIVNEIKIKPINEKNYSDKSNISDLKAKIYKKRNEDKIQLIEENEFFILYEIKKINKVLPTLNDVDFKNKIKNMLYEKNKFTFNKNLIDKINSNNFNNSEFTELAEGKINKIDLDSVEDDSKFSKESVKLLYNRPLNSFSLITDTENNIFLAKITSIFLKDIQDNTEDFIKYNDQSNVIIKDTIYTSYDYLLNNKYEIKINQKTLDRVKNYFK